MLNHRNKQKKNMLINSISLKKTFLLLIAQIKPSLISWSFNTKQILMSMIIKKL